MRIQIKAAVLSAAFLAGAVGIAFAQGSITQDPGSLTPGNLTFQDLGPAGTITSPGTSWTGFGAGNSSGFVGNAAGSRR